MELLKKIWKEVSVFALVLVIFVGLLLYKQVAITEYKTISWSSVESKIEKDESFVLFMASDEDDISSYEDVVVTYMEKNDVTIYFADLDKLDDASTYLKDTFDLDKTGIWTLGIVDGEVAVEEADSMNYYAFSKMMERYEEAKK